VSNESRIEYIKEDWIKSVVEKPEKVEIQSDGRVRKWAKISEKEKYLRVILLEHGETVHILLKKHLKGTLVSIKKEQYKELTHDSIVDCNNVFSKTIEQIIAKLKNGELKTKKEMDISIVEELRNGVCNSPFVDQDIIDMLTE
jgi:hypothetical protein